MTRHDMQQGFSLLYSLLGTGPSLVMLSKHLSRARPRSVRLGIYTQSLSGADRARRGPGEGQARSLQAQSRGDICNLHGGHAGFLTPGPALKLPISHPGWVTWPSVAPWVLLGSAQAMASAVQQGISPQKPPTPSHANTAAQGYLVLVGLVHQVPGLGLSVVVILGDNPVADLLLVQLPVLVQVPEIIELLPFRQDPVRLRATILMGKHVRYKGRMLGLWRATNQEVDSHQGGTLSFWKGDSQSGGLSSCGES